MPTSRSFALSSTASQKPTPFYQKHKMSLTQTYYLAHTARSKLSKEAARSEYDLRVLVGHANLLDNLMVELADAEREQENWFNESVRRAETSSTPSKSSSAPSHISWADTLPPVVEDASSEEESDEEMISEPVVTRRRAPSPAYASITEMEVDSSESESESDMYDEEIAEDEDTDSEELSLTRVSSRASFASPPDSPPELLHELETSDEEDEDTNTPPSPPTETFPLETGKATGKHTVHKTSVALKQEQHDWQISAGSSHQTELYI